MKPPAQAALPLAFQYPDGSFSLLLWSEKKPLRYRIQAGDFRQTVDLPADTLCGLRSQPAP